MAATAAAVEAATPEVVPTPPVPLPESTADLSHLSDRQLAEATYRSVAQMREALGQLLESARPMFEALEAEGPAGLIRMVMFHG